MSSYNTFIFRREGGRAGGRASERASKTARPHLIHSFIMRESQRKKGKPTTSNMIRFATQCWLFLSVFLGRCWNSLGWGLSVCLAFGSVPSLLCLTRLCSPFPSPSRSSWYNKGPARLAGLFVVRLGLLKNKKKKRDFTHLCLWARGREAKERETRGPNAARRPFPLPFASSRVFAISKYLYSESIRCSLRRQPPSCHHASSCVDWCVLVGGWYIQRERGPSERATQQEKGRERGDKATATPFLLRFTRSLARSANHTKG